jgi:hypothetical protein
MKSAQQSLIPLNVLNINKTLVSFLFHLHLLCSFFSCREENREKLFFFFYLPCRFIFSFTLKNVYPSLITQICFVL